MSYIICYLSTLNNYVPHSLVNYFIAMCPLACWDQSWLKPTQLCVLGQDLVKGTSDRPWDGVHVMMSIKMVLLLDHDYREDWRAVAISVAMAILINTTLPTTELINGVMHLSNVLPLSSTRATKQRHQPHWYGFNYGPYYYGHVKS